MRADSKYKYGKFVGIRDDVHSVLKDEAKTAGKKIHDFATELLEIQLDVVRRDRLKAERKSHSRTPRRRLQDTKSPLASRRKTRERSGPS